MRNPTPLALAALLLGTPVSAQVAVATASQSTPDPSITGGVLQDVALWVSPGAPASSLFLTAYSNANAGLATFGLRGEPLDLETADGPMTAVAVRDGFPVSGVQQTLAVAASVISSGLVAYTVDPDRADRVTRLGGAGAFVTGAQFSAVALYRNPASGQFFVFAGTPAGVLQQYELSAEDGNVTATLVRTLTTTGPIVGLAVDEDTDSLFVTQQGQGLWRYGAAADADLTGQQLAVQGTGGLSGNVGRVALYRARGGEGYIVVADTGADAFAVYERRARTFVGSFQLVDNDGIVQSNDPVALAATSAALDATFPDGVFAGADALANPQNLKFASWATVAEAFDPALRIDTRFDSDGGTDGGTDGGSDAGGGAVNPPPLPPPPGPPDRPEDSGCSCTSASVPSTALLALIALARLGRRRRD